MADVRYLGAAGYPLWECPTVSGVIIEYVPIPTCAPDMDTDEEGTLHTAGQKEDITPVITTKDHKPKLKTG